MLFVSVRRGVRSTDLQNPSDPSTYPDTGVLSPNPATINSAVPMNEPSIANSTDHSAAEYSGQRPGHFSSNSYAGYPEI